MFIYIDAKGEVYQATPAKSCDHCAFLVETEPCESAPRCNTHGFHIHNYKKLPMHNGAMTVDHTNGAIKLQSYVKPYTPD